jgi:hypothetical protein
MGRGRKGSYELQAADFESFGFSFCFYEYREILAGL